jgi:CTP:phosphocholine cytidylyltransferase-like protein
MTKRNAVIMAAGTSSRFVPLCVERPKGLLEVKGEVLLERQIRQLHEAGITDITVVVGYKAGMYQYLQGKYDVDIVMNEDYERYNNTSSVIQVLDKLADTYLCSSDNYFPHNVFLGEPSESYYSALYADGPTDEYCISTDDNGNILGVTVGGHDSWYMIGHAYFNKAFSDRFVRILEKEYENIETRQGYWEDVYIRHISELPMKINRYANGDIFEFDTLDELRKFDGSYISDTRSAIIKAICSEQGWAENNLKEFRKVKFEGETLQFKFTIGNTHYLYDNLSDKKLRKI